MSSAINRAFVEKHNIPTRMTAAPITVYNVDGLKNSSGQITAFAELHITIRDHAERIDLAITDLKDRDVFLGHDWLVRQPTNQLADGKDDLWTMPMPSHPNSIA